LQATREECAFPEYIYKSTGATDGILYATTYAKKQVKTNFRRRLAVLLFFFVDVCRSPTETVKIFI